VRSRLIGQTLTIELNHDQLDDGFSAEKPIQMVRIHVLGSNPIRRSRRVNSRHVIESLRRKLRALKDAHLPTAKVLSNFDFDFDRCPTLNSTAVMQLA
jgi:hypothetical protein